MIHGDSARCDVNVKFPPFLQLHVVKNAGLSEGRCKTNGRHTHFNVV